MSVANGQVANAATFNGAFLSRTVDSGTVGRITLNNTSFPVSGAQVTNLQRAINEIFDAVGMAGEGDAARNDYSSNNVVTNGQSRRIAIGALDAAFDITSGHDHDGVNSKELSASNLNDLNYFRAEWRQLDLIPTSQIEDFDFFGNTGVTDYDVNGVGLKLILADSIGYLWFFVSDGAFVQTDPGGTGTGVMVSILQADVDTDIASKAEAALALAALSGIDSTAVVGATNTVLRVTYDVGDITDGSAGTAPVVYTLVQNGIGLSGPSGPTVDVSGPFEGYTPNGSDTQAGVATTAPNNRVEVRNYETQTYIEDAEGQKVYGRLTEAIGVWTLSFYTLEAGVETAHSLASQNISVFYREVFTLADVPTFGVDAGILGTLDLTNDVVYATESIAGKILLANSVALSVGTTNQKGTSTRAAHADHQHQGVHAIKEFSEAVDVYGDIILKGSGGTTVTRTGQQFEISSVGEPDVEYRTITAPEAAAESLTLAAAPLTPAKVILDVRGGPPQFFGDDYTVTGSTLSWNGLGLDGILAAGDKVRIVYWS